MTTPGAVAPVNALTVDVEEYFHPNAMDDAVSADRWHDLPSRVERNTHRILDLLSSHDVHATFFVLGWVAERCPRLVDEIAARGHEVGCHGYAHRLVYKQTRAEFRADVSRAKAVLEDRLGRPVRGFRAASYSVVPATLWALDVLIENGFAYDSSIFPIRHDLYGVPGFSRTPVRMTCPAGEILEIPASTVRWCGYTWPVAGGGYLRLLPYRITRNAIRRINREDGVAALVYVHPWELDVGQPRLPAPWRARFRQYSNLRQTEPRLRRLLREFRFTSIVEAVPLARAALQGDRPIAVNHVTEAS